MTETVLEEILKAAATTVDESSVQPVTKADFYRDGFTGKLDSSDSRRHLAKILQLPPNISANALLALINQIGGYSVYQEAVVQMIEKK